MDKKTLHTLTTYFIKGLLSGEKEEELLTWITSDEQNRLLFLQEQARISREIAGSSDNRIDKNWLALRRRIGAGKAEPLAVSLIRRFWPVAAAFLVGAMLTVATLNLIQPGNDQPAQVHQVTTPRGARTHLTLPDGSKVWLNAGTTLSYSPEMVKNRQVELEGEAYFEVEKTGKPFRVSTGKGEVVVTGTSFNVKAFPGDELFETTLTEGSVVVRGPEPGREAVLNPGQQAVIEEGRLYVRNVETRLFTSWREGKLIFYREPFPQFIKRLERWYNVSIVYGDRQLDELWYTGTIEMETISEVMEMVSKAAPVRYSFDNKTRIFTIRAK